MAKSSDSIGDEGLYRRYSACARKRKKYAESAVECSSFISTAHISLYAESTSPPPSSESMCDSLPLSLFPEPHACMTAMAMAAMAGRVENIWILFMLLYYHQWLDNAKLYFFRHIEKYCIPHFFAFFMSVSRSFPVSFVAFSCFRTG